MTGLVELFSNMVRRGNEAALQPTGEPMETVSSTVRFGGDLRRFLEAQAAAQGGVSVQSVVTAILNGVMHETLQRDRQVTIVPRRVLDVFARHEIDMLTAAEILGVPFYDMTPERLVRHIDNPAIDQLSKIFNVRREWILGETEFPGTYPISWYKQIWTAVNHILDRVRDEEILNVRVLFLTGESWNLSKMLNTDGRNNVITLIELTRQTPSGHQYITYDRLQDLHWNDVVTRSYILTLAMFCDAMTSGRYGYGSAVFCDVPDDFVPYGKRIPWQGLMVPDRKLERFNETGTLFPVELMKMRGTWGSASSLVDFVLAPSDDALGEAEFNEVKSRCEKVIAGLIAESERKKQFAQKMEEINRQDSETGQQASN